MKTIIVSTDNDSFPINNPDNISFLLLLCRQGPLTQYWMEEVMAGNFASFPVFNVIQYFTIEYDIYFSVW